MRTRGLTGVCWRTCWPELTRTASRAVSPSHRVHRRRRDRMHRRRPAHRRERPAPAVRDGVRPSAEPHPVPGLGLPCRRPVLPVQPPVTFLGLDGDLGEQGAMVGAEPPSGIDLGDGHARSGQHVIDAREQRHQGAARPRHIDCHPARRGPVGQRAVQQGDEPEPRRIARVRRNSTWAATMTVAAAPSHHRRATSAPAGNPRCRGSRCPACHGRFSKGHEPG